MGLYSFTLAGGGYILIGAWESLRPISAADPSSKLETLNAGSSCTSPLTYAAVCLFSFLFMADSLISLFSAVDSNDGIGSALQLQMLPIAALFFLYSILGLATEFSITKIRFPSKLLNLIALFGFVEEFLLYYLQKKDKTGIENRYFDLLLVPIAICIFSTLLELKPSGSESESSCYPRLGRGFGLILHGTWFVQMGISFYSNLIVQGCHLRAKSRGNYTIACKGHPEYHRANGIATLQFNCHLALIVVLASALYSSIVKKMGGYRGGATAEMVQMESGGGTFTLESDDDEIREEENENKELRVGTNGYGSHD
ncbi:unnamed protein product [Linum tenue]|uniref:Uncharacterized protein n=1 Tax=Linum tenue TaxID=586396 RepID=A0AAV0LXX5_9ROSI|nr:unnamed protein product [Linum tenue]